MAEYHDRSRAAREAPAIVMRQGWRGRRSIRPSALRITIILGVGHHRQFRIEPLSTGLPQAPSGDFRPGSLLTSSPRRARPST